MASRSRELGRNPYPKHPLQITTRAPKEPDFKFELLPLHSPLLRQSLLVSFPPLIDMLKFSGYSYLIRGQLSEVGVSRRGRAALQCEVCYYAGEAAARPPLYFGDGAAPGRADPQHQSPGGLRVEMT